MKLMNKDEFIAYELKFYFMKNKLKEGEKLPSERDLAEQFGVQTATVRSAYKLLEDEGIIECRERSGNYIAHRRMISNLDRIRSFSEKLEKMGAQTRSRLLAFERVEVDKELNKSIKLPLGTPLFKITRIRMVVEEDRAVPITIEYSYIPESKAPKLMRFDLEDNSLFDILIQEYHHIPKKQELTVGIVYADENEAKALNVDKLTALVKKEGITYDEKGEVMEYLQSVINKEWVAFEKEDSVIKQKMEEVLHGL